LPKKKIILTTTTKKSHHLDLKKIDAFTFFVPHSSGLQETSSIEFMHIRIRSVAYYNSGLEKDF